MSKESRSNRERFYFTHDHGARNDPKILELRAEYGLEGLGLYWCIIETLAESSDGYINPKLLGGISVGFGIAKAKLQEHIDFMIDVELLHEDEYGYYSKRMMKHKKIRKIYSDAGKKGAETRWGDKKANGVSIGGLKNRNSQKIAKERKVKESKGKKKNNTNSVFDFREALLNYGFEEELVDEWLTIRKNKRSVNSEFAYNSFIAQVERAGVEKNELLRIIAESQWAGFQHAWLTNRNNNLNKEATNEADRQSIESAKRKQEILDFARSVGMAGGEENQDTSHLW